MTNFFIFRRNLRVDDNLLFTESNIGATNVALLFFDKRQLAEAPTNPYGNPRSAATFISAAYELRDQLRQLHVPLNIVSQEQSHFLRTHVTRGDVVFDQFDVSPFAKERQQTLAAVCKDRGAEYILVHDASILPIGTVMTGSGSAFKKYTPFYRAFRAKCAPGAAAGVAAGRLLDSRKILKIAGDGKKFRALSSASASASTRSRSSASRSSASRSPSYRAGAEKVLRTLAAGDKAFRGYTKTRDIPALDATTHLSLHLHFGIISPREFWLSCRKHHPGLIQQIIWREFYMYVVNYYHTDYSKRADTLPKMNRIPWAPADRRPGLEALQRWRSAQTGIPFVDAGMREIIATGYMHNRMRMVVAMFLIHYLRIHWAEGERFFAQTLVDYSYCNNFGGWVWCAGTEIHSNPWYRIFSIEKQMQRYDPDAAYVKRWIPELEEVPPQKLYDWPKHVTSYRGKIARSYNIDPIITDLALVRERRIAEIRHALQ